MTRDDGVAALRADRLGRRYGRAWGLRDCTFAVPAGSVVGLVGPNGAGKTTLLSLTVGLLAPTEGEIAVFGEPSLAQTAGTLSRVGYLAQDHPLRVGHLIRALQDKAEAAAITVRLVDERGTSSTCPACARRVPNPAGRNFGCPHCGHHGHRDLVAAANIAARNGGGGIIPAAAQGTGITHRRAGTHLPGVHPARRDPRRRPPSRPPARGPLAGTGPPPAATSPRGVARHPSEEPARPPGQSR